MKIADLENQLDEKDVQTIRETFEEEQFRVSAMRWMMRGLKIYKSIRKVKTDIEIKNNVFS